MILPRRVEARAPPFRPTGAAVKHHDSNLKTFLAHRAALVDYATPITGCRARAEDVVQDAYLRFVPRAGGGERGQSVAYLYRIVRNLALDLVRRSAMESRHQVEHSAPWLVPGGAPDPAQAVLHGSDLELVAEVLRNLPEERRLALEMYRFGGYRLKDIALRLGVSSPTVHRMIRDAMLEVTRRLEERSGVDQER